MSFPGEKELERERERERKSGGETGSNQSRKFPFCFEGHIEFYEYVCRFHPMNNESKVQHYAYLIATRVSHYIFLFVFFAGYSNVSS